MRHDERCEWGRVYPHGEGGCGCAARAWARDPLPAQDMVTTAQVDMPVMGGFAIPGWGYAC